MKIYDIDQSDPAWLLLRLGKVTASEADAILTPHFKACEGKKVQTYLYRKVAEKQRNAPLLAFTGSWVTEQGQNLEQEARSWLDLEMDGKRRVRQVGFIEHDNGRCGCSPDGLLDDDGGMELKCPQPPNHVKYLLEGVLPDDYAVQVHFSLYVTGRPWWLFVSYCRKFPPFVLRVERDEVICAKIEAALESFYIKFDAAMEVIKQRKNSPLAL